MTEKIDPSAFYENRAINSQNHHQGNHKRVLCVCSAGLLRSPTAALVLSQEPYNYNTRSVGLFSQYALIPIDPVHIIWADEIVCMTPEHEDILLKQFQDIITAPIKCLNIDDDYAYRSPELIELIKSNYKAG